MPENCLLDIVDECLEAGNAPALQVGQHFMDSAVLFGMTLIGPVTPTL